MIYSANHYYRPSLTFLPPQTGAIDDLYRTNSKTDDAEKLAEGKKLVEQIVALKYEIEHDRELTYVAFHNRNATTPY
jgi:hypothetical protein